MPDKKKPAPVVPKPPKSKAIPITINPLTALAGAVKKVADKAPKPKK